MQICGTWIWEIHLMHEHNSYTFTPRIITLELLGIFYMHFEDTNRCALQSNNQYSYLYEHILLIFFVKDTLKEIQRDQ